MTFAPGKSGERRIGLDAPLDVLGVFDLNAHLIKHVVSGQLGHVHAALDELEQAQVDHQILPLQDELRRCR